MSELLDWESPRLQAGEDVNTVSIGVENMASTSLTGKDSLALALHQLGSVEFLRSGAYCNLNDIAQPFGKRIDN